MNPKHNIIEQTHSGEGAVEALAMRLTAMITLKAMIIGGLLRGEDMRLVTM